MREILFRGRRVDNGEYMPGSYGDWVYGYYTKHETRQICPIGDDKLQPFEIKHLIVIDSFADWNMPRRLEGIEVDPETVGQYTGMTDRNGNKIFEEDFFKDDDEDGLTLRCIFKDGAYCVEIRGAKGALTEWGYDEYAGDFEVIECENISYYDGYLEIIGNIHDGI